MADNSAVNNEELITVYFHGQIELLQLRTNVENGLTCEAVLQTCITHVGNKLWGPDANRQLYGPKYLPTFGLVVCPEEQTWIPFNHVFKKTTEIKRTYKFRVRFRPPNDHFNNSIMCEYLFMQILDDFLKGPIGKAKELESKTLFALLEIALMFPAKLPYDSSEIVDEKFKTRSFNVWNFTKCFSKEIAKKFITQPFVDHYWVHKAIKSGIREYKQHKPPASLGYYASEFYRILMGILPKYCFEVYTAFSQTFKGTEKVTVNLGLFNGSHTQIAVFYGEDLQCSLNDIYDMSLKKPKDLNDKKWIVQIDLTNGPPKFLEFEEESTAESFVTMIQGYFNLYVYYDRCFCRQLQTVGSKIRAGIKSFGPLGQNNVERNFKDLKSNTESDSSKGKFIIHESLSNFGQYDVHSYTANHNESQSGSMQSERIIKSATIEHLQGTQLRLSMGLDEAEFDDCLELRKCLINAFGQQLYPANSVIVADINEDFQIETDNYAYDTSPDDANYNKGPLAFPIMKDDLTDKVLIPDKNILIKKYEVYFQAEKMMLVELQSDEGVYAKSFREGLKKLYKLNRIKPSSFLKFYNLVLDAQFSVLMEHVPLSDALTYICTNPQTVRQKVNIMDQIVVILSVMEKAKLYHGNLRLRKFMTFVGQEADFVTIKLGDPGVSSHFDTLPLEHPDNIERSPWLSPQRWANLMEITCESELYSVGTTLYELLRRSDQLHEELNLGSAQNILNYLREKKHLPCPPFLADLHGESSTDDTESNVLSAEAREVFEMVWNMIMSCWTEDVAERSTVPDLLEAMKGVKEKVELLNGDTILETFKNVLYDIGVEKKEMPKSKVTLDQLRKIYETHVMQMNLHENCIYIDYKEKLGYGNFGTVWKGRLRDPIKCLEPQTEAGSQDLSSIYPTPVAVKRIKRNVTDQNSYDAERRSMYKEVITACKLDHPNIVKYLHLSLNLSKPTINKESYYPLMIIMEFMNVGNLTSYAKNMGDLSTSRLVAYMLKVVLDVAEGMVYLSGKAIVHRDLAARNILLTKDSTGTIIAKVSDFGLARAMEENYRFYRLNPDMALPCYWMPPECLSAYDNQTHKFSSQGDVWSFGTVMWEAFSKGATPKTVLSKLILPKHPQDGVPAQLLYFYKVNKRLPQNPYMDNNLYKLMKMCWEFEQQKRPAFVELVQKLKAMLTNVSAQK